MRISILFLFFFVFKISTISACTCALEKIALKKKVKTEFQKGDVIFTGNVIKVEDSNPRKIKSSMDPIIYTFEVIENFKGTKTRSTIKIYSERSGASCGYEFKVGETYLVYSREIEGYDNLPESIEGFYTGLCDRNNYRRKVSERELRLLRRFSK